MKKIFIIAIALASLLSYSVSYSQTFSSETKNTMAEAKKLMDNTEQRKVDEANNRFEEANFILESVEQEDLTLEKYFSKGSTPKAEKKAVNVKIQRIEANRQYANAYNMIFDAMDTRLAKVDMKFPADREESDNLVQSARTKLTKATSIMDNYRFLDDSDLKTYLYEDLKSEIASSNKTFEEAIDIMCQAFNLYFTQDERNADLSEEEIAWANASSSNTYDAFEQYIAEFPNGDNIDDARQNMFIMDPDRYNSKYNPTAEAENIAEQPIDTNNKPTLNDNLVQNNIISGIAINNEPQKEDDIIVEPEEEPVYSQPIVEATKPQEQVKKANVSESSVSGVVYRVQIIAVSRGELSDAALRGIYTGNETIHKRYEGGMYKYSLGEFKTFREANNFKNSLGIESFVVKFKDGNRVN